MGAQEFECTAFGKTAEDAFNTAVQEALYEYGHRGYTGTISEKGGFQLFEIPPRFDVHKVIEWVSRGYTTKQLIEAKVPIKLRPLVAEMNDVYDDKWGPAVAIKITGKKAKELRERYKYKGRKGDFYIFCGWASS